MLKATVPAIKKTSALVQEISASTKEQSTGSQQISVAVQQLDQVIQQNASAAAQLTSTSEEFTSQAQRLTELVSFFKVSGVERTSSVHKPKASNSRKKRSVTIHKFKPRAATSMAPLAMAAGHDVRPSNTNGVMVTLGPDADDESFE